MQYKKAIKCNIIRNGSFLGVNTQDLCFTREDHCKHSTWDPFPPGSFTAWFSIHIIWYVGWCQSSFSHFLLLWKSVTHFLSPCRTRESHTDWPSRQAVSTASSISNNKKLKKENENKSDVKPTWGWFHSPMGIPTSKKNPEDPDLSLSLNHAKPSYIFGIKKYKNFPSPLSTHFLYFHYSTLRFLQQINQTPWPFLCSTGKSSLTSSPFQASLFHTLFLPPLAINLDSLASLSLSQMKTIAG